ncbi:MAG: hypothetical protein PUI24_07895 [Spirochaetales bacterium]|nr:hypothetical protein [Spirochaetales bacterium]
MQSSTNASLNSALSPKLKALQQKIQDPVYIENAVDRIAVVISSRIVESKTPSLYSADILTR